MDNKKLFKIVFVVVLLLGGISLGFNYSNWALKECQARYGEDAWVRLPNRRAAECYDGEGNMERL